MPRPGVPHLRDDEGCEAWRQFVPEWERMLRTRSVGLLMDLLSCKLKDDIPNRLAALKLLIHDCQGQSNKTAVDEDMEIGVTFHLRQLQDHDLGTDAGGDLRCHEDQQYIYAKGKRKT